MNRTVFIKRLKSRLNGQLSESEINDAFKYYEDLFDEAGEAGEADLLKDLGSPELVADSILKQSDNPSNPKKVKGSFLRGFKELRNKEGDSSQKTLAWIILKPYLHSVGRNLQTRC
jgi:hypothetical protein